MPKVRDLYLLKLEQAAMWRRKFEDRSKTTVVRDHFRDRAHALEAEADELAHCIARFGDFEIEGADLDVKKAEVEGLRCGYRNPWVCGLAVIEQTKNTSP